MRKRHIAYAIIIFLLLCTPSCNDNETLTGENSSPISKEITIETFSTFNPSIEPTTNQPTATISPPSTPVPTRLPDDYLLMDDLGFGITIPLNWETEQLSSDEIIIYDTASNLYIYTTSRFENEVDNEDDLLEYIYTKFFFDVEIEKIGNPEILLANNPLTLAIDLSIIEEEETTFARLLYAHHFGRGYYFVVIAEHEPTNKARTLSYIFDSVHFFHQKPFGLSRENTLFLLGGYPQLIDLDPALYTNTSSDYIRLMFSGLVRLSPDLDIIPDLAESWSINEDGTEYTFHLRQNAKFSSNIEITANDIKNSWERVINPDKPSPYALLYLGDIQGVKDKIFRKSEEISGIEVLDEYTLKITLDTPKPFFLAKLTSPVTFVIDPLNPQIAHEDWVYTASASGPYKIEKIDDDTGIFFKRNENYLPLADIENIVFLFPSGGSLVSHYENQIVDALQIDYTDTDRVSNENDELNSEWLPSPSFCTRYISLDSSHAPLNNQNLRKALIQAIDKERFVENLTYGLEKPAAAVLPPGFPGYQTSDQLLFFDIEQAQNNLTLSGYLDNPEPIILITEGDGNSENTAINLLTHMWKENLDLDIQVVYIAQENFISDVSKYHGHMLLSEWCADYPDPSNFFDVVIYSDSDLNLTGYNNIQIDQLIIEAQTERDNNKRLNLYQQIEQQIISDFTILPLYHPSINMLVNPRISNYPTALIKLSNYHLMSVETP
jgi:oligopeptide transport system substrate-binding protein